MEAIQNSCLDRAGGIDGHHVCRGGGIVKAGAEPGPQEEDQTLNQAAAFHLCGGRDPMT